MTDQDQKPLSGELIQKNKVGAPNLYKSEYCDLLIKLAKDGDSRAAFCMSVGITYTTFHNWVNKYPEFAHAYELSLPCKQAFYEKTMKQAATGKLPNCNATALMGIMNNWFRNEYTRVPGQVNIEQNFLSGDSNENLSLDEKKNKLKHLLQRHEARIAQENGE